LVLNECYKQIDVIKSEIYKPIKDYVETYNENLYSQEGLLQVKEYFFKLKYIERLKQHI
jgi:molecular chaperone HscB